MHIHAHSTNEIAYNHFLDETSQDLRKTSLFICWWMLEDDHMRKRGEVTLIAIPNVLWDGGVSDDVTIKKMSFTLGNPCDTQDSPENDSKYSYQRVIYTRICCLTGQSVDYCPSQLRRQHRFDWGTASVGQRL